MYELKTKVNNQSVHAYIESIEHTVRKRDSYTILELVKDITDIEPKMWGDSIVGYGLYSYLNGSGKQATWFQFGFSARKNALTLYVTAYDDYIYSLTNEIKAKHGKGCVYINDLSKVDIDVVKKMIQYTFDKTSEKSELG